jgi:hypothetical protein
MEEGLCSASNYPSDDDTINDLLQFAVDNFGRAKQGKTVGVLRLQRGADTILVLGMSGNRTTLLGTETKHEQHRKKNSDGWEKKMRILENERSCSIFIAPFWDEYEKEGRARLSEISKEEHHGLWKKTKTLSSTLEKQVSKDPDCAENILKNHNLRSRFDPEDPAQVESFKHFFTSKQDDETAYRFMEHGVRPDFALACAYFI